MNWRQDARSVIRLGTRRAVATPQSNGEGDPAEAAADLAGHLRRECGGRCAFGIFDANRPGGAPPTPP
ncbi:MAG TPA: hypothetical protein VGA77_15105 [Propylenella sp.]